MIDTVGSEVVGSTLGRPVVGSEVVGTFVGDGVGESVGEAILTLVRAGRPETSDLATVQANVSWGPGPRASQALMLGVRARAVIEGRMAPSIDDVLALAQPILRHRMALTFAARAEGVTLEEIIDALAARIG